MFNLLKQIRKNNNNYNLITIVFTGSELETTMFVYFLLIDEQRLAQNQ